MAGFFGLFGSKTKYVDEVDMKETQSGNGNGAFFLNSDEAKTFGNVEFMNKSQTIKRTFPKTRSSQGGEIVQEISAMKKQRLSQIANNIAAATQPISAPEPFSSNDRRSTDSNLDAFRQMARDMKKK